MENLSQKVLVASVAVLLLTFACCLGNITDQAGSTPTPTPLFQLFSASTPVAASTPALPVESEVPIEPAMAPTAAASNSSGCDPTYTTPENERLLGRWTREEQRSSYIGSSQISYILNFTCSGTWNMFGKGTGTWAVDQQGEGTYSYIVGATTFSLVETQTSPERTIYSYALEWLSNDSFKLIGGGPGESHEEVWNRAVG